MAAGKLSKFVVGVSTSKLNLVGKRERESFSALGVKRLQRYTEDFDVSSGLL